MGGMNKLHLFIHKCTAQESHLVNCETTAKSVWVPTNQNNLWFVGQHLLIVYYKGFLKYICVMAGFTIVYINVHHKKNLNSWVCDTVIQIKDSKTPVHSRNKIIFI